MALVGDRVNPGDWILDVASGSGRARAAAANAMLRSNSAGAAAGTTELAMLWREKTKGAGGAAAREGRAVPTALQASHAKPGFFAQVCDREYP